MSNQKKMTTEDAARIKKAADNNPVKKDTGFVERADRAAEKNKKKN
ncbi:hypothetical protein [Tenacibaculum finnmarkense]|nr:hypothetical protein [Tenacibaculum finnmarkense]MBE7634079.1 hypothetical protein [Tenacibaculum finnmarkense genomovar ulcerans]MCD8409638.1 hypothetical protein [Tenacibaculum finnmarkense genomovar ulcerans]MCD8429835.1 hypothetical protein [Tenacibaculum finnmarkense genomovar ulcerans]MCG8235844.1 hypothetical protein [Tenacibaculum finnmarkense genomovar ulcerans]MCG8829824.1 hypothetical protein [Tenacibaculum finnmarkense]